MNPETINPLEKVSEQADVYNEFKKFNDTNNGENSDIEKLVDYIFEHDPKFLEQVFASTKDLREVIEKLVQLDSQSTKEDNQENVFPFHGKYMQRAKVYSGEASLAHYELLSDKYADLESGSTKEGAGFFQKLIMLKARFDGKIAKMKESSKFNELELQDLEKFNSQ